MATSTFRNKNKVRPIKCGTAKRARVKAQKKRLEAMGFQPGEVANLQSDQLRAYLKRPKLTAQWLAERAEKASTQA